MVVLHYCAVGKGRSVASYNSILCSQDADVGLFRICPHGCIAVPLAVNYSYQSVYFLLLSLVNLHFPHLLGLKEVVTGQSTIKKASLPR